MCAVAFMDHCRQTPDPIITSGWFVHEICTLRDVESEHRVSEMHWFVPSALFEHWRQ